MTYLAITFARQDRDLAAKHIRQQKRLRIALWLVFGLTALAFAAQIVILVAGGFRIGNLLFAILDAAVGAALLAWTRPTNTNALLRAQERHDEATAKLNALKALNSLTR